MKNILFCLNFNITDNRPYSIRALTIAKIYRDLGYNVIFVCVENTKEKNGESKNKYCGFENYTINYHKTRNIFKLKSAEKKFKLAFNNITHEIENSFGSINCMMVFSQYALIEKYSSKYAKKHKIEIIYNSSEWYTYSAFYGKFILIKYLGAIYMRSIKHARKNQMVISRFLEEFYKNKHCKVVRIPSIVDKLDYPDDFNYTSDDNKKIRIMYAGYPGKKDVIKEFLLAINELNPEEQNRLEFYGYGFKEKDLIALGMNSEDIHKSGCINICGQVSQAEIRKALSESEFSILLRENTKNARGGFSTKIVESMMAGVPLIANLTGDMELYFNPNNSIIVSNPTISDCKTAIRKVLSMSKQEIKQMKIEAHQTAIEHFDYRKHIENVRQFMEELK